MKFSIVMAIPVGLALALSACTAREERIGTGALVGGAAGGVIGAAATGRPAGALAGAAIGAASGAVIADATRPRHECLRVRYDAYGNAVCTRWGRGY